MCVGEVRADFESPNKGANSIRIAPLHRGDESVPHVAPRLVGIAHDRAIRRLRSIGTGGITVFPSLRRAPSEANRPQAMGLRIVAVQFDRAIEHANGFPGTFIRMLAVEEHAAHEGLPGIEAPWRLAADTLML